MEKQKIIKTICPNCRKGGFLGKIKKTKDKKTIVVLTDYCPECLLEIMKGSIAV